MKTQPSEHSRPQAVGLTSAAPSQATSQANFLWTRWHGSPNVWVSTVIVQEFLPTQAFCSSVRVLFASQEPFLKFSVPPFPQAPETVPKEANLTAVILAWGPWVLPQPMWAVLPSSMIPHWVGGPGGGGGAPA